MTSVKPMYAGHARLLNGNQKEKHAANSPNLTNIVIPNSKILRKSEKNTLNAIHVVIKCCLLILHRMKI